MTHKVRKRSWLRPVWYVSDIGGWEAGAPYPVRNDEPLGRCTDCGLDFEEELERKGVTQMRGGRCMPCDDLLPPPPPLSWVARKRQRLDNKLHNVYFGYAERFGRRVHC